jgi:RimJ/RimL family protein N-acetyltransferase
VVVIETERLRLRPLGGSDLEDFLALHSEPEVVRFTARFDRSGAARRLAEIEREWEERGHGAMAVLDRVTGRFLGRAGLKYWPEFDETEAGWSLHTREWGHGYATEATRAVLEWGFDGLPLDYVTAMIQPANDRSVAVARRLGFTPLRDDTLMGIPIVVHALFASSAAGGS